MANFIQHKPTVVPHKKTSTRHAFAKIILSLILLAIVAYTAFQVFFFGVKFYNNWNEIKFAYDKPAIVKVMRVKYQEQQAKLDQSFVAPVTNDKTQKLLEDISSTLKSVSSK
jgi:ABC-type multidrug transport system permease subunit